MNSNTNSISVIVPVYNAESTLIRCVDSILAQTYKNFELILVNDGSQDRSAEIIDNYASEDSRVIAIHKTNGGVSSARNRGLDMAKGEYIAFADSDDEVRPNWLKIFIESIGDSDIAVQSIDFVGNAKQVRTIGTKYGIGNEEITTLLITHDILGFLFCKLFRKEIINSNKIRFNENLKFREDDVFVLEYLEKISRWVSKDSSNYIYYIPLSGKKYGKDTIDCTELLITSLDIIYNNNIPFIILKNIDWSIRTSIINKILEGQPISKQLFEAYRSAYSNTSDFKISILNFLILNYSWLKPITRLILKRIN